MKLILRNKFFSLGGSSVVNDLNNNPVYKIKGKIFSPTKTKKIYSLDGKLLYIVRNKFFKFTVHKAYVLDDKKQKIAVVKDKFFNVKKEYFIAGYKDEIKIEGGFMSGHQVILRNGDPIGTIDRKIDLLDAFSIEADETDMPFIIALVIGIDNIVDRKHK